MAMSFRTVCATPTSPTVQGLVIAVIQDLTISRLDNNDSLLIIRRFDVRDWQEVLAQVRLAIEQEHVSLVVIDTLDKFWRVVDENDAPGVVAALEQIQKLVQEYNVALLIQHHLRKMPGEEGTAHRGSGAIVGTVDVALELYCHPNGSRRRILKSMSRLNATPGSIIIELRESSYVYLGTPEEIERDKVKEELLAVLPVTPEEAKTYEQIREPLSPKPGLTIVRELVNELVAESRARQLGAGTRGNPNRFWRSDTNANGDLKASETNGASGTNGSESNNGKNALDDDDELL